MRPPPETVVPFIREKQIQVIKTEMNVSYIEAAALPLPQKFKGHLSPTLRSRRKYLSVATQTSLTWPTGDEDHSAVDQTQVKYN